MARAAAMAVRFTALVAMLAASGLVAPAQAQQGPTSDPIARIAGATEGWSIYFENGQWMRRDIATGKVEPLPLPPTGDPEETGAWRLLEFNFNPAASSNWSVRLSMPHRVQLPRGDIDGILVGELSAWTCEALRGRGLRCTSPNGWQPPAGTWLDLSVDGSRFDEWSAQPIADLTTRLRMPRQGLRGEVDSSADFGLILLSPMDWNQAQLVAALELTFDGKAQPFELERKLLEERTEIEWRMVQPPFVPMTNPVQSWRQPAVAAWRLSTPKRPELGQRVQLRLIDTGKVASFESPLLFDWQRPRVLGISSNCPDGPNPERPACTDQPRLYFDDRPNEEALQRMIDALPAPLYAYASQLRAERDRTRSRKAWSLPLHGAERETSYRIDWPVQAAQLEGRPIEPASYTLSIGAHEHYALQRLGPKLLSLRRGEVSPWRWMANAHHRVALAMDHFGLGGERQRQDFAQPVAADPLAPQRMLLPLDVTQVGWSTIADVELHSHASVADFGLHAVQLQDELVVVATEFVDAAPIAGVNVTLRRDEQALHAETDANGVARIRGSWLVQPRVWPHIDEPPTIIEARLQGRGALLRLRPDADEGEGAYFGGGDLTDSLWWTDSDRYAPGQLLRFRLLARRSESGTQRVGSGTSVKVRLVDHDTVVDEALLMEDAHGGVQGELILSDLSPLSEGWSLRLEWPDGTKRYRQILALPSATTPVELRLELPAGPLLAGEQVSVSATARWADGTPAVGVPLRLWSSSVPLTSDPLATSLAREGQADARFIDPAWQPTGHNQRYCPGGHDQIATTDVDGRAVFQPVLEWVCRTATWRFQVTDLSGESVLGTAFRTVAAQPKQLGVVGLPLLPLEPGPIELGALAVDLADPASTAQVELLFERIDGGGKASAHCTVHADGIDRCRVELLSEGLYQLLLQADGYPRNRFRLAVGAAYALSPSPTGHPVLQLPTGQSPRLHVAHGQSIEFLLDQPHAQARVLLTLADSELRAAQWQSLSGRLQELSWQPPEGLTGCLQLAALIVPLAPQDAPLPPVRLTGGTICLQPPTPDLIRIEGLHPSVDGGKLKLTLTSRSKAVLRVAIRLLDERLLYLDGDPPAEQAAHWAQPVLIRVDRPRLRSTMMDSYHPNRPAPEPWRELEFQEPGPELLTSGTRRSWEVPWLFEPPPALPSAEAARHPPEVAYWQPALELRPGRSRQLSIDLPDHPARWRVEMLTMDEEGRIQFVSHAFVAE